MQGSGSPGPFERKIPFGDSCNTSSKVVSALTTRTVPTWSDRSLKIFVFIPKSYATIKGLFEETACSGQTPS